MKAISIVALLVSLLMMTSQAYSDDKASEVPALENLVGKYKYAGDRATDEARISEEIKSTASWSCTARRPPRSCPSPSPSA